MPRRGWHRVLFGRTFLFKFLGQPDDLPVERLELGGVLYELGEQRNGAALVEIGVNRFCDLIVVYADCTHLSVKRSQAVVVFERPLVGFDDVERSAENPAENKFRSGAGSRSFEHREEFRVLLVVQTERVAVAFRVGHAALAFVVGFHHREN